MTMQASRKSLKPFLLLLAAVLFSAGCNKEPELSGPLVLGAVYDLTGNQSALDIPSSRGAQLAVDEINRAGGVLGKEMKLILRDGETDTAVLRADVEDILTEYPATAAFLGLSDTDQVLAAAGAAASAERVFVTSGATSPQLPRQIPEYLFLACFGDNVQAAAAAEWSYYGQGARTAAVVYDSTQTYTRLLQGYFLTRFEQLGGQINVVNAYDQSNLSQIASGIQGADLLFLAAMPQNVLEGVQRVRQAGFSGAIIGGDSFDSESLWKDQNDLQEIFFTTHTYLGADNPNPTVQAFREAYQNAYNGEAPSAFAALGYDAVQILVQAVRNAGNTDPEAVLRALGSVVGYEGVTGTISYEEGSRIPKKTVTIMEVREGAAVLAAEVAPEQVPAP
jgi:branched-chain amino acid transport system substrate-binding protein